MNAFFALVRTDVALYFANRRAVLVNVAAPILIAAFVGFIFGPSSGKTSRIPIAVTDLDASPLSQRVVAELRADEALAVTEAADAQAQAQLRSGKLSVSIVIPKDFGRRAPSALFGAGEKPEVLLRYDPSQSSALPVVRGLLAQHVSQVVGRDVFSASTSSLSAWRERASASGVPPQVRRDLGSLLDAAERLQRQADAASAPVSATSSAPGLSPSKNSGGPQLGLPYTSREEASVARAETHYNSFAHSFAGMGVQFVLFMGLDWGIALLALRRLGLWKRLRAAPLSKPVLLGSRLVSCAAVAFVILSIVLSASMAIFGVRIEGSLIGLIAIMLSFSLFTAAFGLLIAALGQTPEATRGLAIVVTLGMVMVGGAWVPAFIFPQWLQSASLAFPTRWAVDGLDAMLWRGLGLQAAIAPTLVLLAFAAAVGLLALAKFDWEEAA